MQDLLIQRTTFNQLRLFQGDAVLIITPACDLGENTQKTKALIKEISPFEITVIMMKMGKMIEETYSVQSFEGDNARQLKLLKPVEE